jgi:hypothetical protein
MVITKDISPVRTKTGSNGDDISVVVARSSPVLLPPPSLLVAEGPRARSHREGAREESHGVREGV